jgi:hypothetical protein
MCVLPSARLKLELSLDYQSLVKLGLRAVVGQLGVVAATLQGGVAQWWRFD